MRAAIEASAAGVSVGLVCKSLLGKAHTVMAEGGIAAALANVDDRDNWKVHFADTMRGGQYVNNWRMAELHAKEAPDRVRELEAWGAMFDRTKDGRILQRNFGGHRYPRLAHVGDRTGLEMIRTLQDHGIHQGIDVHMECTIIRLLKDGDRVVGAFGYERERGRFKLFRAKAVVLATGGVGRAYKITSNSWEYTGDGHTLAYDAGAELIDMEFVQFHPTGMIWPPSVRGILVTEGVRGEGGVLKNSEGRRFMFDDIPENYRAQTADNEEEGWRYTQGDKAARRPPGAADARPREPLHRARGQGRPRQPARRRLSRHLVDQGSGCRTRAEHIKKKLPSMYHQFKQLADIDITQEPMEVGPTTHYIMGGVRVDARHADVDRARACSPPASARPASTARIGSAATRSRISSCSASAPASSPRSLRATETRPASIDARQVDEAARRALEPFERGAQGEGPYQVQYALQEMMQDLGRDRAKRARDAARARRARRRCASGRAAVGVGGHREYNPGWHAALDLHNLLTSRKRSRARRSSGARAAAATSATTIPTRTPRFGTFNLVVRKGRDGGWKCRARRFRRCRMS